MTKHLSLCLLILGTVATKNVSRAADTVRVMAYNVLYYGSGCQGPNGKLHEYFKTILSYTRPDIVSLEKMASPKESPDDAYGTAPMGFGDSILKYALNAAFPDKFTYCPTSNEARTNNTSMLFYDKSRFGYVGRVCSYVNVTDFNTYKLYYKDPNLDKTHDTTFLYLTLNHDKSGDEFEAVRNSQIAGNLSAIKEHFSSLPNLINLGDFNTRGADEGCYQMLTATADDRFRMYDPPFFPDKHLKYPAHWDHEGNYSAYFTTSTRESAVVPNNCGTGGGGKNWYDHIFISDWIVKNTNYMQYVPNSYRTVGNDGQRFRVSVHNKNSHTNTSAPEDVIEALFQFSNKYPVMIDIAISENSNGNSPADPELPVSKTLYKDEVLISPEINDAISVHFPESYLGQEMKLEVQSAAGVAVVSKAFILKNTEMSFKCKCQPGVYRVKIAGKHNAIAETEATKR